MKPSEKACVISIISLAMTLLLFFPLQYFREFIISLRGEGITSLLSMDNIILLLVWVLFVSLWIFGLSRLYKSFFSNIRLMKEPKRKAKELRKERDEISLFKEVAEKEYLKRRISEETFKKIMQLCEEKEVMIKAKLKQMGAKDLIKEIKGPKKKKG